MAFSNEQHRKRYAADPHFRARKLAENRAWRVEHREELNAQWYEKWSENAEFRELRRARYRKKKYGLGPEDYARMLAEQNGACAMCERVRGALRRSLPCDAKGARALCDNCNTALGMCDDDADRMRAGAAYLDRARGISARSSASLVLRAEVGCFRLG